jgi:hypothetical protein
MSLALYPSRVRSSDLSGDMLAPERPVAKDNSRQRGEYRDDWDRNAPNPQVELRDSVYNNHPKRHSANSAFETRGQDDGKHDWA